MGKKRYLKWITVLAICFLISLFSFCVFAAENSDKESTKTESVQKETAKKDTEDKKTDEKKTDEKESSGGSSSKEETELKAPCLKQVDSADPKAEVTAFGGMELDGGLRLILTDMIRQLKSYGYNLGFVMVDIKSGKGIAYNPDQVFYSASSVKGLYIAAMTYFYPESFEYNYDTISSVLIYSDNWGYESLWYSYGSYCMECWAEMAGVEDVDWASQMYTDYTARDLAKLWLLNYAYFKDKNTAEGLPELYETPDTSRIYPVLGAKYKTRSKAGWIPTYYDCPTFDEGGIVYAKGAPYVIAFVSDIPEEYMECSDSIFKLLDITHRMMEKQKD